MAAGTLTHEGNPVTDPTTSIPARRVLSALERAARQAWVAWGGYAKATSCDGCGEFVYCRSHHGAQYLCLDCFDQGVR